MIRILLFLVLSVSTYAASSNSGTIWRDGTGVPANTLGNNGDYYLHDITGAVYKKVNGTYVVVANLKGPRGDTGATGEPGSNLPDPTGHAGEFLYSDGAKAVYSKNSAPNPTVSFSTEVAPGATATFTTNAWGQTPFTYQWSKNGINIPGATGSAYVIPAVKVEDTGTYICTVTNANGATSTRPSTLTVVAK